jgi:hypothetical protein
MDTSISNDAQIQLLINHLQGTPVEPGGHFLVDHAGSRPTFIGDRAGMIQVGVAMLRYALEATHESGSSKFRPRSIKNIFSPSSRAQQLILMLTEDLGSPKAKS